MHNYSEFQMFNDQYIDKNSFFNQYDRSLPFKTPDGIAFTNGAVMVLVSDPDQVAAYSGESQVSYGVNAYVNSFFKGAIMQARGRLNALPDFTSETAKPVAMLGDQYYSGAYLSMVSGTLLSTEYHVCHCGTLYIKHRYGHACIAPARCN